MFTLQADTQSLGVLRDGLRQHQFDERSVCARLNREAIFQINVERRPEVEPPADGLDVLIQLFLEGRRLPSATVSRLLGTGMTSAFESLGLTQSDAAMPESLDATCALYPVRGLWLASDRWFPRAGETSADNLKDVVFPGITDHTRGFLAMLPDSPCDGFLELCCGTGIAALDAARRFAKQACAIDILEVCRQYAAWNAAVNELSNVEVAQGNMYGQFAGRTFDRIVVHPPYVPTIQNDRVFADGGQDGEQVTRAAIEGVPRVLKSGGRFYCHAVVSDRENRPWQWRVRDMLGPDHEEFDVAVFQGVRLERFDYLQDQVAQGRQTIPQAAELERVLMSCKVTHLMLAVTVVQRKQTDRKAFTSRCVFALGAGSPAIEWYLRLQTLLADPVTQSKVLGEELRLSPEVTLQVDYGLQGTSWSPSLAQLRVPAPFPTEFSMPEWAAHLLARCDGTVTADMLWEEIRHRPDLQELTHQRFMELLFMLMDRGFLTTPAIGRPPVRPAVSAAESRANPE